MTDPVRPELPAAVRHGGRFLNPDGTVAGPGWAAVWRLRRDGPGTPWPERVVDPSMPPPSEPGPNEVAVTFVGHATFLIRFPGGPTLLTDPIWSERCSPFSFVGPRRARAPGLPLEALPPVDAVLLSHAHYDHLDLPTLKRLRAPRILTGLGVNDILARHRIAGAEALDWGQSVALPNGARATYTPAQHTSARTLRDRGRTLWGGFAVQTPAGRLFFAGDSAYGGHFQKIGAALGPFGVALLSIGAHEPRWFMRAVHMNPAEAVEARSDLGAARAVAMHFGTFKLTQEGIDEPAHALTAAREAAGLPPNAFVVPRFGETLILPLD